MPVGSHGRGASIDGQINVWFWIVFDGVYPVSSERFGFWPGTGFGKRWQRVKDRIAVLPVQLHRPLQSQIEKVNTIHRKDLPFDLDRKYPIAGKAFEWQYPFPARKRSIDSISRKERRYHVMKNGLQKAGKRSSQVAAISKRVGTHALRHYLPPICWSTVSPIRPLQELRVDADVKTTEIYTHVMRRDLKRLTSPLDRIMEDHAAQ
ncbi:MAG TPA: hypothetical protein DCR61_00890 [Verrucomicrobiales bacterium]|nr:hypothetical protein [Verrucomicrobiales bacterium]